MRLYTYAGTQFQQGVYYALGKGVKQNLTEARKCFESAANKDSIYWERLGLMYETGCIVARDIKRAIEYYEIGSNCGVRRAKFRLARLLISRKGLSESSEEPAERASLDFHGKYPPNNGGVIY
jgi:TPR repeat protein